MAEGDREELQRELERRDEEILRLRDVLAVKDAELGEALGKLREMEVLTHGVLSIARRVPGATRLARSGLRRLGGRRGPQGG